MAARHARVVHDLAAAAAQLRRGAVRDERAAAARPAPQAAGGRVVVRTDRAPGPGSGCATLAAAAAAAARRRERGARARARPLGARRSSRCRSSSPSLVAAVVAYRRLRRPRGGRASRSCSARSRRAVSSPGSTRLGRRLHVAAAGGALAASLVTLALSFRGERVAARPVARLRDADEAADHVAAAR